LTELAPPNFAERLKQYFSNVERAGSEAGKAFLFLELVRDIFKQIDMDYLEKLYPELEKYIKLHSKTLIVRGRPDAFLGNLIIEFKQKLDKVALVEAESELKKYIAILWSKQGKQRVPYITVATDGVNFVVHRPRTAMVEEGVLPEEVALDEIDRVDISRVKVGYAFVWLDRYMLYRALRPATAEDFSREFGLNMPAYKEAVNMLKEAWKNAQGTTLYDQWASFLRIVYGSSVESEDLFIKHTYLATVAKLLAYASFSGGALPVSDEQLEEILEGRIFSEKWGVHNFLEEDFFSWIAREDSGLRAARMILERLGSYDLSKVDEDILKALYQDLVDPEARHDLGEYYTPDWLAEFMIGSITERPENGVLDPACGSGTFLAATIRKKVETLENKFKKSQLLEHIQASVQGVDVHPLAVILARTTYLISLGTSLLSARKGPFAVPVYMANSIRLPEEEIEIYHKVESYRVKANGKFLRIPRKVAEDPNLTDGAVEILKEYARAIARNEKHSEEAFQNLLFQRLPSLSQEEQRIAIAGMLYDSAKTMAHLIRKKRDTVWSFILKNIYKPLFLKTQKFDVLIGNPPWLAYHYVESLEYQNYLKELIIKHYSLLPLAKVELMTHMELATLFFVRCVDLYLKEGGTIAFVMPRSVFVADQHHNFRVGAMSLKVEFTKMIDLEDVEPLFKVPSCVMIARKKSKVTYPVPGLLIKGELNKKNARLNVAQHSLTFKPVDFYLCTIGARSFIGTVEFKKITDSMQAGVRSDYYEDFRQGATIVPRAFWFIHPVMHPKLGINPRIPYVKTSDRAEERAKEEYEDVHLEGQVEDQFLYAVMTGSEILPFGHLEPLPTVLPIEPLKGGYRIINSQEAGQRGFVGLRNWLKEVESIWESSRKEKAAKESIYEWLDYRRKLSTQKPKANFKVLYPGPSATYVVSCVVSSKEKRVTKVNDIEIPLKGLIIDHALFACEVENEDEAHYLCAFLNSKFLDELIKPMQSAGLWGPRNIHKKVLEIPIPRYSKGNASHAQLVKLGKECHRKVSKILPTLAQKYTSIGKIRSEVKEALYSEIQEIDEIVRRLLLRGDNPSKNLIDYT